MTATRAWASSRAWGWLWAALAATLSATPGCSSSRRSDPAAGAATSSPPIPFVEAAASAQGAPVAESPDASLVDGGVAQAATVAPLPGFFEALPVAGHPDAWMSLPTGATGKRPVVVVIHGAGDRPDWQCGGWRRATSGFPFIVCPRGKVAPGQGVTPDDVRYTHVGGPTLLAYIDGALAAVQARYPDYVDTAEPVLAGFSLGSYAILQLAVKDPKRFSRIALVEGITDKLDDAQARAFLAGGGQRVLFGCGQRGCKVAATAVAQRLAARDHLDAHVAFALVNHTFDPPLEDAVRAEMPWLVQGDERWRGAFDGDAGP
jgi:pimeloyl-ACP methyl ester carboxylesterase